MNKILLVCLLVLLSPLAWGQTPTAPAPSNATKIIALPPSLPSTPVTTQLNQTLQTLVGVPSSQPLPPVSTSSTDATNEDNTGQVTDTFATRLLNTLAQTVDLLKTNGANWSADVSAWPDFMDWLGRQSSDPRRKLFWNTISNDLLIVVGAPALIGISLSLLLLPLRLNLRRKKPATPPERVGLLIGLLSLRLLPVFIFLGVALFLLDQNEPHKLHRFVILNVIYALFLATTIRHLLRGIFAPTADHLRLFKLSNHRAVFAYKWVSLFSLVIIYGYFLSDVAASLHVPANVIVVFQNAFGLILTIMAIYVIARSRQTVALIIRGTAHEEDTHSFRTALRVWISENWHTLSILYLVIGLIVTMLGIDNGVEYLLRATILTFVIFISSRLSFIVLEWWKTPANNTPSLIHRQVLSFLLRPIIWAATMVAIAAVWGFRLRDVIATPLGQKTTAALVSIGLTLFVLTVLYEMLTTSIDRHLMRKDKTGKQLVASARARTLLPMVRNTVFILFCGIAFLICLSAIGINIGPLLAGAGVVGVAIGFGSQSLVKDFLTGLFIVVENTIAIGDVVKIGEFGGVVEALSIRTLRLRDTDGSLHILPFSEVSKITNMTRGFGFAVVDIGVSYSSDLERVMAVLREIGNQLQEDPIFKRVILEPIEVIGVENLGDSSVTIRARIRTRPGKQWDVRRLLLLRIKQRFDLEKIEIPFPTVTHITKTVKSED